MTEGITPSQTVGPFFAMRLPWPDGPFVVPDGTPGAITIVGRMYDGAGNVIPDGLVETWQADPVLASIAGDRRDTLIARAEPAEPADPGDPSGPGTVLRFNIRLQGDGETVFFDV